MSGPRGASGVTVTLLAGATLLVAAVLVITLLPRQDAGHAPEEMDLPGPLGPGS